MTGIFLLDWAAIAASLFNTVLLLWLGLTVLLNAERRDWGVWATGGGILMGAAFFVSHTVILAQQLNASLFGLEFWWRVGWVPVTAAPFAWYVVMLWYAGYWNDERSRLRRRHRLWLVLTSELALGLIALVIFANPLPSFEQVVVLDLGARQSIAGISILLALYPAFVIVCILLSIDALRRPEPPDRTMGDLARQRARPWLIASAVVLLIVSMLVTGFMAWVVRNARTGTPDPFGSRVVQAVTLFDLGVASLVGLAVVLLGQAIVSYEVFTGKALPRRGFFRHWRSAVILAAGYAVVIGWSLAAHHRAIYSLLLTTTLMATFYALFSWRSFVERERFMASLRPFMDSQRLIHHLVDFDQEAPRRAAVIFEALCRDVLNAQRAQLSSLGALAPLMGESLQYPIGGDGVAANPPAMSHLADPEAAFVSLAPQRYRGLRWGIPLWAERGLIGVLMLGPKRDGGLYTQEEIEVARASGERIVDMLAGEEMARRLMSLQRKRLGETRVLDQQTRRVLHDEVLPELHTAALGLSNAPNDPAVRDTIQTLTSVHHQIADLIHTLPAVSTILSENNLPNALREMVAREFPNQFDDILWEGTSAMPRLDHIMQEVVFYAVREAVRNAALHGRGQSPDRSLRLTISIHYDEDDLSIVVQDDGVGPESQARRSDPHLASGSQGGLALHGTLLAAVGGHLMIESISEGGTQVSIIVPALVEEHT